MKNIFFSIVAILFIITLHAQVEPGAGNWKTWFISSGKEYKLAAPPAVKDEIHEVITRQQKLDSATLQQIAYWNAGAPGYRWQMMIAKLWMTDISNNGALANMLMGTATYDATVAAWHNKYIYKRLRPFEADSRIRLLAVKPESPSYPCEHSVAAGVAETIISHFYPKLKDSVSRLAKEAMDSRVAAGVSFPADTKTGYELGKKIAMAEIEHTRDFTPKYAWDGKRPDKPGIWNGPFALLPLGGHNKTVVLDSGSQFRPGPPPDFAREMEELKNFKPTFRSTANAFYWASQDFWGDALHKKIFEHNIHLNPPRAARLYAIVAVASYDCLTACFDAKYAYWGIRPDQYDTTYRPVILHTPPFPGYPSGHAMMGGMFAELYSYFFPAEKNYFDKKAEEGAESRFQAGIHFRTDNDMGVYLGRKVAQAMIRKIKTDGADKDEIAPIMKN